MLCSVPSRFFGQRINRVVGAKENTAPAPKRWMVFGSLGRNLSLCDGKSERIVPLTAQARKGLGAGLGAIPAPPPGSQKPLGSLILRNKKICLLQHQVPSNFLLKIISQETQRGSLWREAVLS